MEITSLMFCRKYFVQLEPLYAAIVMVKKVNLKVPRTVELELVIAIATCISPHPICLVSTLVICTCKQITTCMCERLRLQLARVYGDMSLFQ